MHCMNFREQILSISTYKIQGTYLTERIVLIQGLHSESFENCIALHLFRQNDIVRSVYRDQPLVVINIFSFLKYCHKLLHVYSLLPYAGYELNIIITAAKFKSIHYLIGQSCEKDGTGIGKMKSLQPTVRYFTPHVIDILPLHGDKKFCE